jgi:hypothetical protein
LQHTGIVVAPKLGHDEGYAVRVRPLARRRIRALEALAEGEELGSNILHVAQRNPSNVA